MVGDRDLLAFRQGYYDLLVALLWREPPGELLAGLSAGIAERIHGARKLHRLLGEGWEDVARFLEATAPDGLADAVAAEYTRLFIGPQGAEVNPYESYYLTGRVFDRPLAALRGFLSELGVEKVEGYSEPEDFVAFELDIVRSLIRRQGQATTADEEKRWFDLQTAFLTRHLLVWGPAAASDISAAKCALFYKGVGKILQGFLEMERELVAKLGQAEPPTLDAMRQAFGRTPEWQGPLFDPSVERPAGP